LGQSRERLVYAGHSSILTYRRDLKKRAHIFDDASIILNMMLMRLVVVRTAERGTSVDA
jgi:hypothetical protein